MYRLVEINGKPCLVSGYIPKDGPMPHVPKDFFKPETVRPRDKEEVQQKENSK